MNFKTMFAVAAMTVLAACASKRNQQMEAKMEQQPSLQTPAQIEAAAQADLASIPNLSDEQRTKLQQIQNHAKIEAARIKTELGQARSLLFKTVSDPNSKRSEINWAKNKIVKLERQRVDLMLNSVDQVEKVIGRKPSNQEMLERYFDEDIRFAPQQSTEVR